MSKKLCQDCGCSILDVTHDQTGGYCIPCKKYRDMGLPGQKLKNAASQITSHWAVADATDAADQIPLSPRTERAALTLFDEPERSRILGRLLAQASKNVPFCEDATPEEMERIRFSIMKLIAQNPKNEEIAFEHARVDWRDLFTAAGFAESATEHERWYDTLFVEDGYEGSQALS